MLRNFTIDVKRGYLLSVPYFTGFVMLQASRVFTEQRGDLSVPYFTGFVMLHGTVYGAVYGTVSFSPLFYGIRDVTPAGLGPL